MTIKLNMKMLKIMTIHQHQVTVKITALVMVVDGGEVAVVVIVVVVMLTAVVE